MIPIFLKNKILNTYGESALNDISKSYLNKRYVTLRINTLKTTKEEILNVLNNNKITYQEIPWYEDALVITNKAEKDLSILDIYKEGKIYLQSLSSMIPPLYLEPMANELILDMAAAPGSKTSQICALSNNESLITALEKNKIRCERLKYNLDKLGAKKVNVLNIDARKLDSFFTFDKILLDAPCSGSGTLTEYSLSSFNEELINRSISIQYDLLKKAIHHLKVGGTLIYSTCSILKEENEDIIAKILKENANIILEPIEHFGNIPLLRNTLPGTITVCPTNLYEGFFVAKLKKIK